MKRSPIYLKRSTIKHKARKYKVSKSGQVTQNAQGLFLLRMEVFARSGGRCENTLTWKPTDGKPRKYRCPKVEGWEWGELHHIRHRARGGSDELFNLAWICRECHRSHHDGKLVFEPWEDSQ